MSEDEKELLVQIIKNQLAIMRMFADKKDISVFHEQGLLSGICDTNLLIEKMSD